MRLELAPVAHQLFELRVAAFGQHDPHGGEQVAFALLGREALALETEDAPGTGAGRDRKLDCAVERRHPYLGTEHRLIERDGKLETQIGPAARKQRTRSDRHRDQKVAGTAAGTGEPLPLQANDLPLAQPGRELYLDLAAGRPLPALVVLAHGLVSRIQLGKARGRSRVVLVGVRMQLLRLPAEGALDLGGTRRLRYPEDLIGVTHPQPLPLRSPSIVPGIVPISQRFNVVGVAADRNITAGGLRVAPGP